MPNLIIDLTPGTVAMIASAVLLLSIPLLYGLSQSLEKQDIWSIGIYRGADATSLRPVVEACPALTGPDVTDARSLFVADPFLVRVQDAWWMFFEYWNVDTGRGEIACASSPDCLKWTYGRKVLCEPFHLSYPHVFEVDGVHYMVPESAEAGCIRLYRASSFPFEWTFVGELLSGDFLDPSIVRHNGRWWLFAMRSGSLSLYHADALTGPWTEHPASPIVRSSDCLRPGGRIVRDGQRLVSFAQDGRQTYGHQLFAFEILTLTEREYAERPCADSPVIGANGRDWCAQGMHHADLHLLPDGSWIAAVDGKRIVTRFNWRRGVRAVLSRIGLARTSTPAAA